MIPFIMVGLALALAIPATAQTPVGGQGPFGGQGAVSQTPPPKAQPGAASASPASGGAKPSASAPPATKSTAPAATGQPVAKTAISADMRQQAEFQRDGAFQPMDRPGAGGQIQDAWDRAKPNDGVYVQKLCQDCVYKVRSREFMTTTVILPEDAVITSIDPGDEVGFQVKIKSTNKLVIRPTSWGMETNLNVNTKSGAVYPLYTRSETINSVNIPDLVYKIVGREKPLPIEGVPAEGEAGPKAGDMPKPADKPTSRDFVHHKPLDVSKFHGWDDYQLWGDDELRPETIWRDEIFTYIKYGKKWNGMELSTGYVTIDGYDELVNSHVEGTVFVIESVSPLVTLKNGKKYLCIQYTGSTP